MSEERTVLEILSILKDCRNKARKLNTAIDELIISLSAIINTLEEQEMDYDTL